MSYVTRADLEAEIGADALVALGDVGMIGAEDPAAVPRALARANADIDAALTARWPDCLGLRTTLLSGIGTDLALGYLARGPQRTEEMAKRAEAAAKKLDRIAAGDLVPCTVASDDAPSAGEVSFETGRRVFAGGGF